MKRIASVWLCVMLICVATGCGSEHEWEDESGDELEEVDMDSLEELYHIRITAGDTVLYGVLYDTQTSRDLAVRGKLFPNYSRARSSVTRGSLLQEITWQTARKKSGSGRKVLISIRRTWCRKAAPTPWQALRQIHRTSRRCICGKKTICRP